VSDDLYMVQHGGRWYVVEQEDGRARLTQLEVGPVRVHWNGLPDGETPVVEMGKGQPQRLTRSSGRRAKGSRRALTLGEHFWFTALVTAVILVLPVAMTVCNC
jgi:hypothetical protein